MEGFICPECKESFQTAGLLENHFNSHFEGPSIKSLLTKAKDYTLSWISNEEESAGQQVGSGSSGSGSSTPNLRQEHRQPFSEDQPIGRATNLTKVFRAVRPKRISHSQKEANKLHLRLDKLVSALLSEIRAGKKNLKEVEKSVIPWNDDSDVCVGCGEILSVLQLARKHHCRLCTGVLCSTCSRFVPLQEAVDAVERPQPEWLADFEHSLRLCDKCQNVIASAKEEIKTKNSDHTMEENYRKLLEAKGKCDSLVAVYTGISQSLRNGEATYTLDEGNVKRVELIKQFKIVDTFSERIAGIRTNSPTQLKVQNNVRAATRSYLQEHLPTTAPLPELREIHELQKRRLEESRIAIQAQKQEALRTQNPSPSPPTDKVGSHFVAVEPQPAVRDGWSTKSKKTEISQDIAREKARDTRVRGGESAGWTGEAVQPQSRGHPLLEQKEILRGYLRQAIRDNRQEEIDTLKQNLHMILDEIRSLGLEDT
ncbi:hypothetical protein ACHWQZ_G002551 [Mnemiopsis leidyi]